MAKLLGNYIFLQIQHDQTFPKEDESTYIQNNCSAY